MAKDFDAKNIIVGAATFYVGPAGIENTKINVSASTNTAQDPTKVVSGVGASWFHLGYTQNGVTMNIEPTYGEVMVDQLLDVARLFKSSQRVMVATSLTETTLENLYVAIGSKTGALSDLETSANLLGSAIGSVLASADGSSASVTGSSHFTASGNDNGVTVSQVLDINGGALGYTPVERSVCFVGPAPARTALIQNSSGQTNAERLYIGYRAVSMDAVGVAVQRDNATLFPVNFRLLPSESASANDGNATYGKIVDRVY
jgi:hypothetical protein